MEFHQRNNITGLNSHLNLLFHKSSQRFKRLNDCLNQRRLKQVKYDLIALIASHFTVNWPLYFLFESIDLIKFSGGHFFFTSTSTIQHTNRIVEHLNFGFLFSCDLNLIRLKNIIIIIKTYSELNHVRMFHSTISQLTKQQYNIQILYIYCSVSHLNGIADKNQTNII